MIYNNHAEEIAAARAAEDWVMSGAEPDTFWRRVNPGVSKTRSPKVIWFLVGFGTAIVLGIFI